MSSKRVIHSHDEASSGSIVVHMSNKHMHLYVGFVYLLSKTVATTASFSCGGAATAVLLLRGIVQESKGSEKLII